MNLTAIWHNGEMTTGSSWRELEDNIRSNQWTTFKSRLEFRDEMRHRAFVWSGDKGGIWPLYESSQHFLRALEKSGMFLLIEENETETESK